ncbi:hypothetical protein [Alcanivorax sp. DP30]|uniref:hypothetical protein n=1 Tax=Alcanivorax sp. DP30 TaxID=2606217 RepID=UPI00136BD27A|nr:hypothetical protein [Alcanivorax sp. DP30]MZR63073.1 hypothetical protein [Alcanivorax sp. DP30]
MISGLLLFLVSGEGKSGELTELDDDALSGVMAREGIALNLEVLINATQDNAGNIIPDICPSTGISGTPDCRFALQFNSVDNAWLVVKDYYGLMSLNEVRVDGVRMDSTASGKCDADCLSRFSGFDPNGKPAIQLSYDHSDLGASESFYGDAELFLHAGKVAAEFNDSGTGTPGYLRDMTPGSAIGLLMADGPNGIDGAAKIRFDGNVKMYGY